MIKTYASYADMRAICPFISQLVQDGDDEYFVQRMAANIWIENAIRATSPDFRGSVVADSRVVRACAYKAVSEVLRAQITPMMQDNAYEQMAVKFQRTAESEISTLKIRVRDHNDSCAFIDLSVHKRGYHG